MDWIAILWLLLSIGHGAIYIFGEEHDLTQLALAVAWLAMFRTVQLENEK